MEIPMYQVDAFTNVRFGGNPAAVCVLNGDNWLEDDLMLNIAGENNLAETAFILKDNSSNNSYLIRWFTPELEMDLCGHATLASAHVLFTDYLDPKVNSVTLNSTFSGTLIVSKQDDGKLAMLLPSRPPIPSDLPPEVAMAMGKLQPQEVYKSRDYVLVYNSRKEVEELTPDPLLLSKMDLGPGGIIATAKSDHDDDCDFVSRFFNAGSRFPEDPVTGSAHCSSVPYWADRMNKKVLLAKQVSQRVGTLYCRDLREEGLVEVAGNAVTYMKGVIYV